MNDEIIYIWGCTDDVISAVDDILTNETQVLKYLWKKYVNYKGGYVDK